ncbi:HAMP domain-containing histidine kinase [Candidatus Saccharibacteria bacterium]|nr:HAMP domain-containing histidine kinase [Candidatus Saccharibacteria bacterium]
MESEVFSANSGTVVVAHELKAPLSLMRQLALSLELEQNPAEVQQISQRIVATSDRAIRQVNDLLKVARLDDALFEMEPVNPRAVCDDVVGELWRLFSFNRRELQIDYRNKRRLVVGNRQLLYSVIYNFCLNAMNYGGEELPSIVSVRDKYGTKVRIAVRDFGPAIPTKIWREIKNGYVEQPVDIAMRPGSSGLGLYIAAKFANYMQGDFGLIRHRDGTSFYIDLPISGQLSLV